LVLSHDGVYTELGYFRFRLFKEILLQLFSVVVFFIPVSALIADRIGRRKMLIATTAIAFFGFAFSFFLNSGSPVL
jgi:MFS family permease